jgi:hypothetical protein
MMSLLWFAVAWSFGIMTFLVARFELGARRHDIGSLLDGALALNPLFVIAALTLMPAMLWANGRIRAYRLFLLPLAGVAFSLVPICVILFSGPAIASLMSLAPEMLTRQLPLPDARGVLLLWVLVGTTAVAFGIALSVFRPTPPRDHPGGAFSSGGATGAIADRLSVKERAAYLSAALVVPFVVQVVLSGLASVAENNWDAPAWMPANGGYAVLALSVISGLLLVRRGWRAYMTPIAVVYIPAMCYLLVGFPLWTFG